MIAAFDPGTEQLLVETDGRVAKITLNRPEARNALSCPLIRTAHRYLKDNLGEAFSIDTLRRLTDRRDAGLSFPADRTTEQYKRAADD